MHSRRQHPRRVQEIQITTDSHPSQISRHPRSRCARARRLPHQPINQRALPHVRVPHHRRSHRSRQQSLSFPLRVDLLAHLHRHLFRLSHPFPRARVGEHHPRVSVLLQIIHPPRALFIAHHVRSIQHHDSQLLPAPFPDLRVRRGQRQSTVPHLQHRVDALELFLEQSFGARDVPRVPLHQSHVPRGRDALGVERFRVLDASIGDGTVRGRRRRVIRPRARPGGGRASRLRDRASRRARDRERARGGASKEHANRGHVADARAASGDDDRRWNDDE